MKRETIVLFLEYVNLTKFYLFLHHSDEHEMSRFYKVEFVIILVLRFTVEEGTVCGMARRENPSLEPDQIV